MLEPTHRLQELAGWPPLLFSFIWLAGFSPLIANACLAFAVMGRILTHYRGENHLSSLIAWPGAEPRRVVQESMLPEEIGVWVRR